METHEHAFSVNLIFPECQFPRFYIQILTAVREQMSIAGLKSVFPSIQRYITFLAHLYSVCKNIFVSLVTYGWRK